MMKKYLFMAGIIPLVLLIILALPGNRSFQLSGEMVLEKLARGTHIISVHKFKEMKTDEPGIQLVDLREVSKFSAACLPGAINLFVENSSSKEIHRFFRDIPSFRVIYADQTYQAESYWILLTQMGIADLFVLDTGPLLDSLIINWESENSKRILVDEVPVFRFQPDTSANN
jgi:rhodanese-related sulfurtransferase